MLSRAFYIYVLLKKTLECIVAVPIFTALAPICTVFQAPSGLPELSFAVIQVHRELLPQRHCLRKPRKRNELQVHRNLKMKTTLLYVHTLKTGGCFISLSYKVLHFFI